MATGSTQLTCFLTLVACVASVLVSLWLTSSRPPAPGEVRIFTAADLAADARLLLVVVGGQIGGGEDAHLAGRRWPARREPQGDQDRRDAGEKREEAGELRRAVCHAAPVA